jgi:uncharacterized integral membrane protein
MLNHTKQQSNELWLKAAVVGGLWASIEIIVGSFLHNTRLPFAGTILAVAGTILLIGFYQIWPHKGLIIRAGLITALMKSVSPSALILGPMTGIFAEALLVELVIRLLGSNLVSYLVAGIFSVASALFHKIISLLIVYGFDLVKVYVNLINFGLKQLRVKEAQPLEIFLVLLAVYVMAGMAAAWMGYMAGKRSLKMSAEDLKTPQESDFSRREFFPVDNQKNTSTALLFLHVLALPLGLFLLNFFEFYTGLIYVVVYTIAFGFRYQYAMRRLRKPVFWLQMVFILVLSTFFWNAGVSPFEPSIEGARVGFEMMVRALFVVVAFTSLSAELRNEKVRSFLYKAGMGQLYQAIGLAFSALPTMIALLPTSKQILRHPVRSLLRPMAMANHWLEIFKNKAVRPADGQENMS